MQFVVDEKNEMALFGIKQRCACDQQEVNTMSFERAQFARLWECLCQGSGDNLDTVYTVLMNFSDDGYDYYIAANESKLLLESNVVVLGEEVIDKLEHIVIPAGQYLICKTHFYGYPVEIMNELRHKAVTDWFSSASYELRNAPEIGVVHRHQNKGNKPGYCELWLPIVKKET